MREATMPLDQATVLDFAQRYLDGLTPEDRKREDAIAAMVPAVRERGYIAHEEFLDVCDWKSKRIRSLAKSNNEAFIKEATRVALSTSIEEIRIGALRLLKGVDYPVASVFLHWFGADRYPILDQRALASLGIPMPTQYTPAFWIDYVHRWRSALRNTEVTDARMFDRALWQWSKEFDARNKRKQ